MRRLLTLAVVVLLLAAARSALGPDEVVPAAGSTLSFGFLLLVAYLFGDLLSRLRLPRITGYILAGILLGPDLLALVDARTVSELKLIDDLALTFIALAAGSELRLETLRDQRRSIALTILTQTVIVSLGVAGAVLAAQSLLPFLVGQPVAHTLAVAALLGTLALARSPASAIAIISESKAHGPFTETVLGVTVALDVGVVMLFALVVALGQALVMPDVPLDLAFLGLALGQIAASLLLGVLLGLALDWYITTVQAELLVFILAVAFLVTFASQQVADYLDQAHDLHFHLEPMLICLAAGFWVRNFTAGGEELSSRIDRAALVIFVVFFSLTGAALDLDALRQTWQMALLLVGARAALIWIGAYLGATLAGDPPRFRRLAGLSYLTQAGVSLGLAGIVLRRFPEWGPELATLIVAAITLNQVIGPVTFKWALDAVGEAHGTPGRR